MTRDDCNDFCNDFLTTFPVDGLWISFTGAVFSLPYYYNGNPFTSCNSRFFLHPRMGCRILLTCVFDLTIVNSVLLHLFVSAEGSPVETSHHRQAAATVALAFREN